MIIRDDARGADQKVLTGCRRAARIGFDEPIDLCAEFLLQRRRWAGLSGLERR